MFCLVLVPLVFRGFPLARALALLGALGLDAQGLWRASLGITGLCLFPGFRAVSLHPPLLRPCVRGLIVESCETGTCTSISVRPRRTWRLHRHQSATLSPKFGTRGLAGVAGKLMGSGPC